MINIIKLICNSCGNIYSSILNTPIMGTPRETLPLCPKCGCTSYVKDRDNLKPQIPVKTIPSIKEYDY